MSYADNCFCFDSGNREIKLEEGDGYTFFENYDSITLRRRQTPTDVAVSLELWGKMLPDTEILLSRDNAMLLATKLMRAVQELDADIYREYDLRDLDRLKELHSESM